MHSVLGKINMNREVLKIAEKPGRIIRRDSNSTFVQHQDVPDFVPENARDDCRSGLKLTEREIGYRMIFVAHGPRDSDGCIQNKTHDYIRPSSRMESISSRETGLVRLRISKILCTAR